ncbi:LAETG motif-containing sortase-dependent surface protein [Streptomyces spongiae]|uniref:LAETG motif-containing sortase-dependent surface protein n=1 Tax=Streptomyces spongiae TaxID=565072 RepID=UPI002AD54544|nr:LAETG motif-containing sortase-dependent surface protein [Streptomyces spongiae]
MRFLGVVSASAALVLGVASNAMACTIRDFSAKAECDAKGKGVISVTDVDPTGVTAEVSVYLENNGADERLVGTQTIKDSTAKGVTVTFSENWKPNAEYRIHIKAEGYVDEDIKPNLTTPSEACKKGSDKPPASETPKPSDKPSDKPSTPADTKTDTPTPSESESESTSPAPAGDGNAPAPEGDSNLAETGADSNTPVIAGVAAAFLAVGGGSIYYGTRRRGASTR